MTEHESSADSLWIKIKGVGRNSGIMVGVCYRPPSQIEDLDEILQDQIKKFSERQDLVVMGDFNYPDICWKTCSAQNGKSNKFLTCLADNFISQKVEGATRGCASLELILTNREKLVDEVKVVGALGSSDHVILDFMILGKTKTVRSHKYRLDFRRANFKKLKVILGRILWSEKLKKMEVQEG